jgi:transcription initiation factor TFIIB
MCGRRALVDDDHNGEALCVACGFVVGEKVPVHETEDSTAVLTYRPGRGLGSLVGPPTREKPTRLQALDRQSTRRAYSDSIGANMIQELTARLSLPPVLRIPAMDTYRRIVRSKQRAGYTRQQLAAASLFFQCRVYGVPRALRDFAVAAHQSKRTLWAIYRKLCLDLDATNTNIVPPDPVVYTGRMALAAGLPESVRRRAVGILNAARAANLSAGKHPLGTAAGALYIASLLEGIAVTQDELEAVAGITAVSIRHSLKSLVQALPMQELSRYAAAKKKQSTAKLLQGPRPPSSLLPPPSGAADHHGQPAGASGSSPSGTLSAPYAPDLFSRSTSSRCVRRDAV